MTKSDKIKNANMFAGFAQKDASLKEEVVSAQSHSNKKADDSDDKKVLNIRVPVDVYKALKMRNIETGESMTEQINQAIVEYLKS